MDRSGAEMPAMRRNGCRGIIIGLLFVAPFWLCVVGGILYVWCR